MLRMTERVAAATSPAAASLSGRPARAAAPVRSSSRATTHVKPTHDVDECANHMHAPSKKSHGSESTEAKPHRMSSPDRPTFKPGSYVYEYSNLITSSASSQGLSASDVTRSITDEVHVSNTSVIRRRYRCERALGRGGFARCFEVIEEGGSEDGTHYALKVVSRDSLCKPKTLQKLHSEIAIHQRMKHTHIVNFVRTFSDRHYIYMVLELCSNGTLMDLVKVRPLNTPEAQYITLQCLFAMQYMQENGVIHRDLKPSNIMLDAEMRVKIGDFGLAAELQYKGQRKRTVCGTPNYIAPEIIDRHGVGHSFEVDTWSLGVMLYTILVGKPPFQMENVAQTYSRIRDCRYVIPDGVPHFARRLIQRILIDNPTSRPTLLEIRTDDFFIIPSAPMKPPASFASYDVTIRGETAAAAAAIKENAGSTASPTLKAAALRRTNHTNNNNNNNNNIHHIKKDAESIETVKTTHAAEAGGTGIHAVKGKTALVPPSPSLPHTVSAPMSSTQTSHRAQSPRATRGSPSQGVREVTDVTSAAAAHLHKPDPRHHHRPHPLSVMHAHPQSYPHVSSPSTTLTQQTHNKAHESRHLYTHPCEVNNKAHYHPDGHAAAHARGGHARLVASHGHNRREGAARSMSQPLGGNHVHTASATNSKAASKGAALCSEVKHTPRVGVLESVEQNRIVFTRQPTSSSVSVTPSRSVTPRRNSYDVNYTHRPAQRRVTSPTYSDFARHPSENYPHFNSNHHYHYLKDVKENNNNYRVHTLDKRQSVDSHRLHPHGANTQPYADYANHYKLNSSVTSLHSNVHSTCSYRQARQGRRVSSRRGSHECNDSDESEERSRSRPPQSGHCRRDARRVSCSSSASQSERVTCAAAAAAGDAAVRPEAPIETTAAKVTRRCSITPSRSTRTNTSPHRSFHRPRVPGMQTCPPVQEHIQGDVPIGYMQTRRNDAPHSLRDAMPMTTHTACATFPRSHTNRIYVSDAIHHVLEEEANAHEQQQQQHEEDACSETKHKSAHEENASFVEQNIRPCYNPRRSDDSHYEEQVRRRVHQADEFVHDEKKSNDENEQCERQRRRWSSSYLSPARRASEPQAHSKQTSLCQKMEWVVSPSTQPPTIQSPRNKNETSRDDAMLPKRHPTLSNRSNNNTDNINDNNHNKSFELEERRTSSDKDSIDAGQQSDTQHKPPSHSPVAVAHDARAELWARKLSFWHSMLTPVWVTMYADFSDRFGLAYRLNTGHTGVHFNDSTRMIMHPDKDSIEYYVLQTEAGAPAGVKRYTKKRHVFYIHNYDPTQYPQKKVLLIKFFCSYLDKGGLNCKHYRKYGVDVVPCTAYRIDEEGVNTNRNRLGSVSPQADAASSHSEKATYARYYHKTGEAIIFRLSNDFIQVCFHRGPDILIGCNSNVIAYTDTQGKRVVASAKWIVALSREAVDWARRAKRILDRMDRQDEKDCLSD